MSARVGLLFYSLGHANDRAILPSCDSGPLLRRKERACPGLVDFETRAIRFQVLKPDTRRRAQFEREGFVISESIQGRRKAFRAAVLRKSIPPCVVFEAALQPKGRGPSRDPSAEVRRSGRARESLGGPELGIAWGERCNGIVA